LLQIYSSFRKTFLSEEKSTPLGCERGCDKISTKKTLINRTMSQEKVGEKLVKNAFLSICIPSIKSDYFQNLFPSLFLKRIFLSVLNNKKAKITFKIKEKACCLVYLLIRVGEKM